MANAGTAALTTAQEILFSNSEGITTFSVSNDSGSAGNALIRIPELHGTDFFPVAPGDKEIFRANNRGIKVVQAKADTTATLRYGVVAVTNHE